MFPVFIVVVLLAAAACVSGITGTAATPTPLQPTNTPHPPEETAEVEVIQVEVEGVRLAISVPPGWEGRPTGDGIFLAEHLWSVDGQDWAKGMQAYVFVHPTTEFNIPEDVNAAWSILREIVKKPAYIGDASVSQPEGFDWDGFDAAYYLMNSTDGSVSVLVAVALTQTASMVVCNVSAPREQAAALRRLLPELLGTLWVNGAPMTGVAVDALPSPLVFPPSPRRDLPGSQSH